MIKKLFYNLPIKVISLMIAVVIWVVIMSMINPVTNGSVSVPLKYENENYVKDQNKDYRILDSTVIKINFKTKANKLTDVEKPNNFTVYIDLKDVATSEIVPVRYKISNNVDDYISNIEIKPESVRIALDDTIPKSFKVQHKFIGKLQQGKTIGSISLLPDEISVLGSSSKIDQINHLSVDIDLSQNDNKDFINGEAKVNLCSEDGTVLSIDGITVNPEKINYQVMVISHGNLRINVPVVGTPESGYTHYDTKIEPANIMVEGLNSLLLNYTQINLPPINIDGFNENKEFTFPLSSYLKGGVKSSVGEVKVSILIHGNVINSPIETKVGPHLESELDNSGNDTLSESKISNSNIDVNASQVGF